ncbi:MAG: STAS/SEC14 domain-containing protein [Thermoguttaceae bacterium]
MIETIETGSRTVVGFKLCGKLHDEDYKRFVPTMETILTAEGKVRLFIQLEDLHGWDLHAAWDDLKFSLKHYSDFERIAMLGDRKWEKWMANFCKPFTKAKVQYFDRSQVDAAWKWLEENEETNSSAEATDRTLGVPDEPDAWNSFRWYGP